MKIAYPAKILVNLREFYQQELIVQKAMQEELKMIINQLIASGRIALFIVISDIQK